MSTPNDYFLHRATKFDILHCFYCWGGDKKILYKGSNELHKWLLSNANALSPSDLSLSNIHSPQLMHLQALSGEQYSLIEVPEKFENQIKLINKYQVDKMDK